MIIAALAGSLLYGTYAAYATIRAGGTPPKPNMLKYASYAAGGVAIACILGGIAFEVALAASDADDWWLDSGFYGGLVGAVLSAVLFRLAMRSDA